MPWWEFEAANPFAVKSADDPEVSRAGTAGTLIVLGMLGFAAFLIFGLFSRSWSLAFWGIIGSTALASAGGLLLPNSPKRS